MLNLQVEFFFFFSVDASYSIKYIVEKNDANLRETGFLKYLVANLKMYFFLYVFLLL